MRLGIEPSIGEGCQIENCSFGAYVEIGIMNYLENSSIDDYSYTGQFCFLQNSRIGRFSNIAAMVRTGPTSHPMERPSLHHFTYRRRKYGFSESEDEAFFLRRSSQITTIGHDTWIGHGAVIMPGIKVDTGAVIGAGAVVTRDVPPYGIAVGIPARTIKMRFPDAIINGLLDLEWWHWPHETIKERLEDFSLATEQFLKKYGALS